MTNDKFPALNTDRVLWRENPADSFSDTVFVTDEGGIGISHGGHCIVMPASAWHALSKKTVEIQKRIDWLEALFKFDGEDEVLNTGPNDPVTKDCVVVRRDYYHQIARKEPKGSDRGAQIIQGLREAAAGDFARVTLDEAAIFT